MFYAQFILDKKGPLGTIWIAAHLERKLRKNQVADTDIGLSVDSILFPEVPIALRLSSHLLLGVVRIYSKKVNYLFHDCSEALVKIKQAFRSTAVDLPPEESTAPYNSITLPETFDLDNFELPESALLSSNFVDHHVSTREQITLQDTVNGASHPTSMFGLDERFGDGDASHIGLEFEQELFMDKHFSPLRASFSIGSKEGGILHGEPSLPSSSLGNDGQLSYNEGNCSEIPNELSELLCNNHDREGFSSLRGLRKNEDTSHCHSYSTQTPDLNEAFIPDYQMAPSPYIALTPEEVQNPRLIEPAQGPSTPRLLEVIPSNFQEIPALSPQERAATMPVEPGMPWRSSGPFMEVEYPVTGNETKHTDTPAMDYSLGGTAEVLSSSVAFEQRSSSLALTHLDENLMTHNSCLPSGTENMIGKSTGNEENDLSVADQMQANREVCLPSSVFDETGNLDLHIKPVTVSGAEPILSNLSTDNVNKIDVSVAIYDEKTAHNCTEPSNMSNPDLVEDIGSCLSRNSFATASGHLRPCSSNLPQDVSSVEISELSRREQFSRLKIPIREETPHLCKSSREVEGDDLCSTNFGDSNLERQKKPGYMSSGVKSGVTEPHGLSTCGPSKVLQPGCFNSSSTSEFLEPEKTLVPSHIADFPNDSGQQTVFKGVAESDGSVDRISTISKLVLSNHLNYSSSSEFLEPEKILASACNSDFTNGGQQTADKRVAESDGSVDRLSTLFCKKRRVMDSSTVQQTGTAAKLSGVPRSWRNAVPDDDDLLASILVGRKSQLLKIGTTLSPSTALSHKRPRTMPKFGMLKRRKVLVDDTMFLLADTIRQQLLNTEEIRRIRKKAPCTRPEIWRINIYETEEEIFKNCVLTGATAELNSLECRKYSLPMNQIARVKNQNSRANTSGEVDLRETSQFVNEAGAKVFSETVLTPLSLDHVGGATAELNRLECQKYSLPMNQIAQVKNQNSCANTSEEVDPRETSQFVNEAGAKVFSETVLSPLSLDHVGGATAELNSLECQKYSLPMNQIAQVTNQNSRANISEEEDPRETSQFVNEAGAKLFSETVLTPLSLDHVGGESPLIINEADMEQDHGDIKQLVVKDPLEQMSVHPLMEPLKEVQNLMMSEMEAVTWRDAHLRKTKADITENAETSSPTPPLEKHDNENINDSIMPEMEADPQGGFDLIMTEAYISENTETCLPLEKPHDVSTNIMEQSLHHEGQDHQNTPLDGSEHASMETIDNSTAVFMDSECLIHAEEKHANAVDMENLKCPQTFPVHNIEIDGASVSAHGVAADSGAELLLEETTGLAPAGECHNLKVMGNEGRSMPDNSCAEVEFMATLSAPTELAPFTVEENSVVQEYDLQSDPIDVAGTRDSSDFCGAIDDNYAELLNVDAEADWDVAEDGVPNPEAAKLLENSGWSVRTRGVAKYLKNLFYEESVLGRKTVAVDRLLFGKTRKEASRMFFETLVLKSRDYIQVEQETPFAYIKIKPRIKLLEAEF